MKFVIYLDIDGAYRWQLYPIGGGPPVACSVKGYESLAECMSTIQRVREASEAEVEDLSVAHT